MGSASSAAGPGAEHAAQRWESAGRLWRSSGRGSLQRSLGNEEAGGALMGKGAQQARRWWCSAALGTAARNNRPRSAWHQNVGAPGLDSVLMNARQGAAEHGSACHTARRSCAASPSPTRRLFPTLHCHAERGRLFRAAVPNAALHHHLRACCAPFPINAPPASSFPRLRCKLPLPLLRQSRPADSQRCAACSAPGPAAELADPIAALP
eukprot:gene14634-biopygen5364